MANVAVDGPGAAGNPTLTLPQNLGTAAIPQFSGMTLNNNSQIKTTGTAGSKYKLSAYDVDGAAYIDFITLTANNTPTCDLSDSVTKAGGYIYRAGGDDVAVADGGTGAGTPEGARENLELGIYSLEGISTEDNFTIDTTPGGSNLTLLVGNRFEVEAADTISFETEVEFNATAVGDAQISSSGGNVVINTPNTLTLSGLANTVIGESALANNATEGFVWIPGGAGAPTGAPSVPYVGAIALYGDTTNHKLYMYDSAWRILN